MSPLKSILGKTKLLCTSIMRWRFLKKKKVYLFIITSIIYLFFCDEILLAGAAESLFNS